MVATFPDSRLIFNYLTDLFRSRLENSANETI